jgi:DNA (cytosine-5)-methyltransferase 1
MPFGVSRPVAIDLFSGAGGFSLGLEQAGFDVGAAVEMASGPVATHRLNFPGTPVLPHDIADVTPVSLRKAIIQGFADRGVPWNGDVTLCVGGPPCQGYSVGGLRRTSDKRNALVHQFRRLVTGLGSRYFVMENVPGLLLPANAPTVKRLIAAFRRAGYSVAEPFIVDASRLGLPQARRRVLLIGWKKSERPVDILALKELSRAQTTVEDAIGDLPEIEAIVSLLSKDEYVPPLRSKKRSAYANMMRELASGRAYHREWDGRLLTGCARTQHSIQVTRRFRDTVPGTSEPISRYRRLDANGLAPTLRAGTGPDHGSHTPPRPIHHSTPRVISVREAARLQSFPDWFRFADTKWHAWQEIGNAVPPLLGRAIGEAILDAVAHAQETTATIGQIQDTPSATQRSARI